MVHKHWSWMILTASFLGLAINGAVLYGAGVIHMALLREFGESDTYTSLVGSVYSSLVFIAGPAAGAMMNVLNCRITMITGGILVFLGFSLTYFATSLTFVLITYGVMAGIGNAMNAIPPVVCIGYYFERNRNTAIGFVTSGAAFGMLVGGALFQTLINHYGLRGAFLLLGGCSANQIVMGALMIPSDKEKLSKIHHRVSSSDHERESCSVLRNMYQTSILKDRTFLLMLAQFIYWTIPVSLLLIHLPNFAAIRGANSDEASFLIFLIGLTGTAGRLLSGMAVGPDGINPVLLYFGQIASSAVLTLLFPLYSSSFIGQCIFSSVFGIYNGGVASLISPVLMEILGLSKLPSALGIMYFVGGVGFAIGPTLAGFLIDSGGTYEQSFYISGSLMLASSFLTLFSMLWRKRVKLDGKTEMDSIEISSESSLQSVIQENKPKITKEESGRQSYEQQISNPLMKKHTSF